MGASSEPSWKELSERSVLLKAVKHWREDPDNWLRESFDRLPETVRVNPLSADSDWVESWLEDVSGKRLEWFKGPGSAWELPFARGFAPDGLKQLLVALHDTGRITRQEAASMLPVLALGPKSGDLVLDLCASPGSKTTQICEHLRGEGAVIANEVVNGRVNTLVSNIHRHSSKTALIVNHDGRHFPKVPGEGFDRILVDAPCTGSGTTRKNPEIWSKWLPSSGFSLHDLQHGLLTSAIRLAKPGARIVYSTCSLDPIENEAVVARALSSEMVKILPGHDLIPSVPSDVGMTDWAPLDDEGNPMVHDECPSHLMPLHKSPHNQSLKNCVRIWNDSLGGGGFFLAVLEKLKSEKSTPSKSAESDSMDPVSPDPDHFPVPIDDYWRDALKSEWADIPEGLWTRGKTLLWTSNAIEEVWKSEGSRKGGRRRTPGYQWHPLKVVHAGMTLARLRKGRLDRITSRGASRIGAGKGPSFVNVQGGLIDAILLGQTPTIEEGTEISEIGPGSAILIDGSGTVLPVWAGAKITPMVNESEKAVLRAIRGMEN
ncbi:MAG: RsmB/NOP family class I SAM-dependent RNA methyltransferase [Candidatus Thermoplasmatota archaeon]|nr:RsmB/NOP family class I SAM-dependent RNA methyltransferase [Candidatus Thermoplasmatota archaeon]